MPSVQVAGKQVPVLTSQLSLAQSSGPSQRPQAGQLAPPQSLPSSSPFWTLSVQLGTAQRLSTVQMRLAHSLPLEHWTPGQARQLEPPQSRPASSPFWTRSLQVGVRVLSMNSWPLHAVTKKNQLGTNRTSARDVPARGEAIPTCP